MCDTIYEAESTYILSDFLNALIYNDHCAVRRISIVAPLQQLSGHFCLALREVTPFPPVASKAGSPFPPVDAVAALHRVSRVYVFKEGLTIERVPIDDRSNE